MIRGPRLDFYGFHNTKWFFMDFIDLGVFWGRKLGSLRQLVARDYTGVVALLEVCNLGTRKIQ